MTSTTHDPESKHKEATTEKNAKPTVLLPGNGVTITETATQLAGLFDEHRKVFLLDGVPVLIKHCDTTNDIKLQPLKPVVAVTEFEGVADLYKATAKGDANPAICSESCAKAILASDAFQSRLPVIDVVTRSPVLTELGDGSLVQVCGYNAEKRIYAAGVGVDEPELDEAVRLIQNLLSDFKFATPGDKSRAIAALITPALVHSGLLGGRPPVDLGEADQSQTGKGYRNKVLCAIYNETPKLITLRTRGVGSLEEAIGDALLKGHNFLVLDNVRGKIDCQMLESAVTEDTVNTRVPFHGNIDVKTDGLNVMMTSNKAEVTEDLANRTSCVRIRKQPQGYVYRKFPEGDLLAHVCENNGLYLGAIFSVVRSWHAKGMPQTNESRHDFRSWAQKLDWIVQKIFGEAALLDGHMEVRSKLISPGLAWIRDVALAIEAEEELGTPLRANEMVDIIAERPDIEIPGYNDGETIEDDKVRHKIHQAIGRRMSRLFDDKDMLAVDGFEVTRALARDENYRDTNTYCFRRLAGHFDERN